MKVLVQLDLDSNKIVNLGTPTSSADAATKAYVDAIVQGLSWKDQCRAASTANINISNGLENGDTIDGVTLATGDRVLLKDQTAPAENGIYVVVASGSASRAADADSADDILSTAVFVQEGTANGNTAWVLTTNAPITLDTTALTFSQFGAGATPIEGTGIDISGTTISLETPVAVANGGTGGASAAAAKASLGFMGRFADDVGDGAATSFNVDHNLNSLDVIVQVYRNSDGVEVIADVTRSTVNRVVVSFAVAPTSDQFRVVVVG